MMNRVDALRWRMVTVIGISFLMTVCFVVPVLARDVGSSLCRDKEYAGLTSTSDQETYDKLWNLYVSLDGNYSRSDSMKESVWVLDCTQLSLGMKSLVSRFGVLLDKIGAIERKIRYCREDEEKERNDSSLGGAFSGGVSGALALSQFDQGGEDGFGIGAYLLAGLVSGLLEANDADERVAKKYSRIVAEYRERERNLYLAFRQDFYRVRNGNGTTMAEEERVQIGDSTVVTESAPQNNGVLIDIDQRSVMTQNVQQPSLNVVPRRSSENTNGLMDESTRPKEVVAAREEYLKVFCGTNVWNVRKTLNGKSVTMQQALGMVNLQCEVAPFTLNDARLVAIYGVDINAFDLKKIPYMEIDRKISIGCNDISCPLTSDEIRFGLMPADAFVCGPKCRWNDLTEVSRSNLVARLQMLGKIAHAQFLIGTLYWYGRGVRRSYAESVRWYSKAAEQGDATAMFALGNCYEEGLGVIRSQSEAVKWYRKSAVRGCAEAQYRYGICYENGNGLAKSPEDAVKWYRKAADHGHAEAMCSLGLCYEKGNGVAQSHEEAVKCYRKAAEQGSPQAQFMLGSRYSDGKGVAKSEPIAVRWYLASAKQGYAYAQYALGVKYFTGAGVDQSDVESARWFREAAEQGMALAQYWLGWLYENGMGVEKSYTESAKWFREAAKQGDKKAKACLERVLKEIKD